MTQYVINIGAIPNDGTGDPLRTAFNETNLNFDQVFAAGPVLSNIQIANNKILTTNTNGNLILAPNGIGRIQANATIVPSVANVRDLGSSTQRWATVYTQYLDVSANLNITGNIIYNGDLNVDGNLTVQGNIIQVGNIVTDSLTIQLANTAGTANAANGSGITVGANDNIATLLYNSTGNTWTTNIGVSSIGNISAPYFIGNGSQLTGLAATYGNANVASFLANFGSNTISTTGNVTTGSLAVVGNIFANSAGNVWRVSTDTLNFPSGASWRSDKFTLDEYISSATDGYLNLQTFDNASNLATELHMEHGVIQLNIYNGDSKTWTFNQFGNTIVPGSILPKTSNTYSLGNATNQWNSLLVSGWIISGGALNAPSGGSWFSNAVSLDEYITSAPDGYINLQSLYANSNVASQVHLEHGLAQIVVDNGSQYIWEFDDSGNLTLPGNTFAVNYANGNPVIINSSSYGNANVATFLANFGSNTISTTGTVTTGSLSVTGNIIPAANAVYSLGNSTNWWSNVWVAGNTMYIGGVPVGMAAGNVLTVGGNAVLQNNSNSTISTTGNITANYFFGNGSQLSGLSTSSISNGLSNVAIPTANSNVTVTANTQSWLFETDGRLFLPNSGVINASGNSVDIGSEDAISLEANTVVNIYTDTNGAGHQWQFGDAGELTLPASSQILEVANPGGFPGYAMALSPDVNNAIDADQQLLIYPTGGVDANHLHITSGNLYNTELFLGNDDLYVKLANTGNIVVNTNDNGGNFAQWTFDTTGNINLPTNGSINFNAGGIVQDVDEDFTILVQDADDDGFRLNLNVDDGAGNVLSSYQQQRDQFELGFPSTSTYYQFNDNGTVVLPSNAAVWTDAGSNLSIIARSVSDSSYVEMFTQDNTDTMRSTFRLTRDTANIVTSSGAYTWSFDSVGNLTSPGAISAVGNITGNYFIGNGSQLTGLPASYSDANVATFLAAYGSNSISTTGNVTAANFIGNISITGNISGTSANVELVAGVYEWTFDNTGNLTLPGNSFAVNYANGTAVSLGGAGSYGNANVADFLDSLGSNAIVTTGNITGGNVIATANILGNGYARLTGSFDESQASTAGLYLGYAGGTARIMFGTGNTSQTLEIDNDGGTLRFYKPGTTLASLTNSGVFSAAGNITAGGNLIATGNLYASGTATTGISAVVAGATNTLLSNTVAGFTGNVNSYSQVTFQNKNTGADATADFILTADNGSDVTNYGDFGIINSGYDNSTPTNSLGNIVYAADTYIYAQGNISNASQSGGNLVIGTTTAGKTIKLFAGGNTASALVASISNTGMAITGTLTTTGNITTGNITGSAANVTITANAFVTTFDTTGLVTFPGNITANVVSQSALPAFRVYGSSSNNIPGGTTITATQGATVDFNQGSHYNNTTGIFTAPRTGVYNATATLRVGGTNTLNQASIQRNSDNSGANVVAFWELVGNSSSNGFGHMSMAGICRLTAGDTLRLQVISGNVQFDINDCYAVTFIG